MPDPYLPTLSRPALVLIDAQEDFRNQYGGAAIADSGADAVGLDWTTELSDARARVGDRVALQGNLDPAALHQPPHEIRAAVSALIESVAVLSGRGSA